MSALRAQSPAGDFEIRADRAADHRHRGADAQPFADRVADPLRLRP
jgi:hypothetical protein